MRAEHSQVPSGVTSIDQLSPRMLLRAGLDPTRVYQMQAELAEVGMGLGVTLDRCRVAHNGMVALTPMYQKQRRRLEEIRRRKLAMERRPPVVSTVYPVRGPMPTLQAYAQVPGLGADSPCPPGCVPSEAVSDQQLRACGLNPRAVRQLERELEGIGIGLGLDGIFDVLAAPFKAVAKVGKAVVTKVVPAVARLVPGALKYVPGIGPVASDILKVGGKLLAPGRPTALAPSPAKFPVTFLPRLMKLAAKSAAKAGKQKEAAVLEKQAQTVERVIEQVQPTQPVFAPAPEAPSAAPAGGMPGWLLPAALVGVGAVLLARKG